MTAKPPLRIAVISDNPDPRWVWIRDLVGRDFSIGGRTLDWSGFSTAPERNAATNAGVRFQRRLKSLPRFLGARALANEHRAEPFDLIVSHGPWPTAWTEHFLRRKKQGARHLAYAFNFTDLPKGLRKSLMTSAFRTVDAFAVFTDAEQELYSNYFDIDRGKFWRAPWGVAPPLAVAPPRKIEGDYFAALGGEARDYKTLCEVAQLCHELEFVAVARPHNFEGIDCPENLFVFCNLPFEEAWSVVWHSKAALLPLRSRETPCGLVTLVGTMHLGKAQIATAAAGAVEYIKDGESGLLTPPGDAAAMATAVRRLAADPALAARLGEAAKAWAATHCSEARTVAFFKDLMDRWFP